MFCLERATPVLSPRRPVPAGSLLSDIILVQASALGALIPDTFTRDTTRLVLLSTFIKYTGFQERIKIIQQRIIFSNLRHHRYRVGNMCVRPIKFMIFSMETA